MSVVSITLGCKERNQFEEIISNSFYSRFHSHLTERGKYQHSTSIFKHGSTSPTVSDSVWGTVQMSLMVTHSFRVGTFGFG